MVASNSNLISRQKAPALEWRVCEDERAWEEAQYTPPPLSGAYHATPTPVSSPLQRLWRRYALLMAALVAVGGAGWWAHQRAEAGIAAVETALEAEIVAEVWRTSHAAAPSEAAAAHLLSAAGVAGAPDEIVTEVKVRDLGADWAIVDVTLQRASDSQRYHQTRVYQEDARGWTHSATSTAHWGSVRRLETEFFTFLYHDPDTDAVDHVAPQIDMLYRQLYRSLNSSPPDHQKLTVTLSPTAMPGLRNQDGSQPPNIVLPSPAGTILPADLDAGDMLLQALVLALFERQSIDTFPTRIRPGQWFRLLKSYRLWYIWEHDLPLARWRVPLVQWVFDTTDAVAVPTFARELCAHHQLWLDSPLEINVPILCWQRQDGTEMFAAWRYHPALREIPLTSLLDTQLTAVDSPGNYSEPLDPAPSPYAIMLATVFDYVTATYGKGMLPLLLSTMPKHDRAETLIPAVFGVPLREFEQGWRAFLVERYGLEPHGLDAVTP